MALHAGFVSKGFTNIVLMQLTPAVLQLLLTLYPLLISPQLNSPQAEKREASKPLIFLRYGLSYPPEPNLSSPTYSERTYLPDSLAKLSSDL